MKLLVLLLALAILVAMGIVGRSNIREARLARFFAAIRAQADEEVRKMPKPKTVNEVLATDGINPFEEMVILRAYIELYFPRRAPAFPLPDGDHRWKIQFSDTQEPGGVIQIDPASGFVSSSNLPSASLETLQAPRR